MGGACLAGGVPSRVYLNGPVELDTVMLIGKKSLLKNSHAFYLCFMHYNIIMV